MGNLDFTNQAGFSWYCILLLISGVLLLGLSGLPGLARGGRVLNLLFGLGFVGYAIYLIFMFHGGTYLIFAKAFIVPVLLIINSIRGLRSANLRRRATKRGKARQTTYTADLAREQAAVQAALAQAQADAKASPQDNQAFLTEAKVTDATE
jgi:hypothetical protein